MTTTTTIQTIDRRARTSDGTVICHRCGEIIATGDRYQQETTATRNGNVEIDVCLPCLTARDTGDWCVGIVVVAATLILLALAAAVFGG